MFIHLHRFFFFKGNYNKLNTLQAYTWCKRCLKCDFLNRATIFVGRKSYKLSRLIIFLCIYVDTYWRHMIWIRTFIPTNTAFCLFEHAVDSILWHQAVARKNIDVENVGITNILKMTVGRNDLKKNKLVI